VTALGPGEIRARRRPWLILAVALCRLLSGLCLAWPLASLLGESGIAERAQGDRVLFEGGSYLLLEVARLHGPALLATARGLMPLLAAALLLTTLCNACLLTGLGSRAQGGEQGVVTRGLQLLPALVVVGIATGLAQAAVLIVASVAVEAVPEPLRSPVPATLGQLAVWLTAALGAGALGGFSDVVKASLARSGAGLRASFLHARRCLSSRPFLATLGWLPYALALTVSILLAAELTEALDVSREGAWRVLAVFLLHQLVILVSVALRAAWYARALRFVSSQA
jgi:hypothetical protein